MYLLSRRSLSSSSGFFQNYVVLSILLSAAFANVVMAIPIDTQNSKAQKAPRLRTATTYVYLSRYDSRGHQIKSFLLDPDEENWGLGIGTVERRTEFLVDSNSPGKLTRRESSTKISKDKRGVVGIIRFKGKEPVESVEEKLFKGIMALPPKPNRFESNIQIKRYLQGSLKLEHFPLPDIKFEPYSNDPWERI
ncbi:hypothetical protein F5880DRAFT_1509384 [Lentinula raphanica]|nr:hypothetical protein F5880DRAFT_1509384 [Lentinula raphanica]